MEKLVSTNIIVGIALSNLLLVEGLINTHQVEEDGSLSSLDDLFGEDERRFIFINWGEGHELKC